MEMRTCSVAEARRRLERGCALVDVREYPEYVEAHLTGGTLVPLGELRAKPALAGDSGEVLLLCRSGRRVRTRTTPARGPTRRPGRGRRQGSGG
jgi:rhodanese-related sulfurtransferase